jgi:hypothetical protein
VNFWAASRLPPQPPAHPTRQHSLPQVYCLVCVEDDFIRHAMKEAIKRHRPWRSHSQQAIPTETRGGGGPPRRPARPSRPRRGSGSCSSPTIRVGALSGASGAPLVAIRWCVKGWLRGQERCASRLSDLRPGRGGEPLLGPLRPKGGLRRRCGQARRAPPFSHHASLCSALLEARLLHKKK